MGVGERVSERDCGFWIAGCGLGWEGVGDLRLPICELRLGAGEDWGFQISHLRFQISHCPLVAGQPGRFQEGLSWEVWIWIGIEVGNSIGIEIGIEMGMGMGMGMGSVGGGGFRLRGGLGCRC